ncbi:copper amine oxidase N-terminal domain-containing protein [Anaerotignum lactatifermentans]|uniref:copper amine oxidase N-terminal domain-containing protein n=1 Tax=Anaerotignum lactatifermentans TaxID=160404 RepID=UPI002672D3B6|nr:copper amine oxidase N-terminal domain-containing protein [Anaerotignum lactatifermentans]
MKKFLSMVMAAAMVVSLVPATAFAASGDVKATAKVVDAANFPVDGIKSGVNLGDAGKRPELQLTLTTSDTTVNGAEVTFEFTLDNGKFDKNFGLADLYVKDDDGIKYGSNAGANGMLKDFEITDTDDYDEAEVTLVIPAKGLDRGTVLGFALNRISMDKVSKGKTTTISVDSSDATVTNGDDLVFASIEAAGIKASVKDTVDVATEEVTTLKDVKIETTVGDFSDFVKTEATSKDELKLKLNSGFEFVYDAATEIGDVTMDPDWYDDDEIVIPLKDITSLNDDTDTWTIEGLKVEATSAKAGSTATMKVYLTGCDTVSVEVATVVDYTVAMTVDEDEDVPVIYSGVDVENTGITDDSDHESLEVTIKETFAGAWNNSKDFTLSVPEGVYIADVISTSTDGDFALADTKSNTDTWFRDAYKEGDYVDLTFKRRTWEETNPNDTSKDDPAEVTFTLTLVADPNFEGDVVLKLTGDGVDEQEVTIAKFVKPYVVEAQQNDMQIDYRNTEIPTSVVIKEAEAGLWDKGTSFVLALDKIDFDDEGSIAVDDKSGLEVKDDEVKGTTYDDNDAIEFTVDSRSDDEPATVTISGMQLYMDRSLPAGAYDLKVVSPEMLGIGDKLTGYLDEVVLNGTRDKVEGNNRVIADINDDFYSETAKAGFVNIVTAGREDTDSFTTKVVVPVGESYLISGENKVEIPVPAYINAAGYTMLPLRAVAVALGINENNVLWDQTTRTATVMYGSKIINMTYGQKVVYVNGAMIPATAAVEITNDRMFLGLRDLGNALGVTDITWDAATKTATLNGNK